VNRFLHRTQYGYALHNAKLRLIPSVSRPYGGACFLQEGYIPLCGGHSYEQFRLPRHTECSQERGGFYLFFMQFRSTDGPNFLLKACCLLFSQREELSYPGRVHLGHVFPYVNHCKLLHGLFRESDQGQRSLRGFFGPAPRLEPEIPYLRRSVLSLQLGLPGVPGGFFLR